MSDNPDFHDYDEMSLRERLLDLRSEAGNISRAWLAAGLLLAVIAVWVAVYNYSAYKDFVRGELLAAYKAERIALCDYNSAPSADTKSAYLSRSAALEALKDRKAFLGRDITRTLKSYAGFILITDCGKPDLDSMIKKPCYAVWGRVLEEAEIKRKFDGQALLTGRGYLLGEAGAYNADFDKNMVISDRGIVHFVVKDNGDKKNRKAYLLEEIKKTKAAAARSKSRPGPGF